MSVASDEINFLVYRYLQESGFGHSAFVFGMESNIANSNIQSSLVPPAALCTLLIKGLCYIQAEILIHDDGTIVESLPSEALSLIDAVTPDLVLQRREAILERLEKEQEEQRKRKEAEEKAAIEARIKKKSMESNKSSFSMLNVKLLGNTKPDENPNLSTIVARHSTHAPTTMTSPSRNISMDTETNEKENLPLIETDNKMKCPAEIETPIEIDDALSEISDAMEPISPVKSDDDMMEVESQNSQLSYEQQSSKKPRPSSPLMNGSSSEVATHIPLSSNLPLVPNGGLKQHNKPQPLKNRYTSPLNNMSNHLPGLPHPIIGSPAHPNTPPNQLNSPGVSLPHPATINHPMNLGVIVRKAPCTPHPSQLPKPPGLNTGPIPSRNPQFPPKIAVKTSKGGNNANVTSPGQHTTRHIHHHHHIHYDENGKPIDPKTLPIQNISSPESETNNTLYMRSTMQFPNNSKPDNQLEFTATTLKGHELEVFICSWSPIEDYLVSGSGDSTARIWDLRKGGTNKQVVLKHCLGSAHHQQESTQKDVCAIDWTPDGAQLATGSYDGHARIWNSQGELKTVCGSHNGPIFALKWSRSGKKLVSSGVDKSCVVWDPKTGKPIQKFNDHTAPSLDVDWKDDEIFASCSTDRTINICQVGIEKPIRKFTGHTDEVNAIRWDPSGAMLASCSDDNFLKIWTMNGLAYNLAAHKKEIYHIKWAPSGPGSRNPNAKAMLASCSFDKTVKLWDPTVGKELKHLLGHSESVYSVSFSPDTKILASGAFDGFCYLWDINSGKSISQYKIPSGGIYDVAWSSSGNRLAIAGSNSQVTVLDFRNTREVLNSLSN